MQKERVGNTLGPMRKAFRNGHGISESQLGPPLRQDPPSIVIEALNMRATVTMLRAWKLIEREEAKGKILAAADKVVKTWHDELKKGKRVFPTFDEGTSIAQMWKDARKLFEETKRS
jgi:hypothetical protein